MTEEQIAKVRECKTSEELVQLAMDEGVELTDEQLDAVAGGSAWESEWEHKHNVNVDGSPGCGGTFTSSEEYPTYCQCCGGQMY